MKNKGGGGERVAWNERETTESIVISGKNEKLFDPTACLPVEMLRFLQDADVGFLRGNHEGQIAHRKDAPVVLVIPPGVEHLRKDFSVRREVRRKLGCSTRRATLHRRKRLFVEARGDAPASKFPSRLAIRFLLLAKNRSTGISGGTVTCVCC